MAGAAALLVSAAACANEADGEVDEDAAEAEAGDAPVAYEDHWHAAIGVYVCDEFLPDTPEFESDVGIHTHGDGAIHIHPFADGGAGANATLDVYLDGAGIGVSGDELRVGDDTYTDGEDTCGDEPGELVIVRWADAGDTEAEPEAVDHDTRLGDGEAYVVAFVPEGADIPPPDSAARLDELAATDAPAVSDTTTTPPPGGGAAAAGEDPLTDGFYQVLHSEPAPCRTPGARTDAAGESCFVLTAVPALTTDVVDRAEAASAPSVSSGEDWRVDLTLTADGIAAFNDVAAACYEWEAACPVGRLALVVDDEVVMAPTISQPSFERDEISVSGDFTGDEARDLADTLSE